MSLRAFARAFVALLRAGALESLAYRGEMLVWALTTTMPLIMYAFLGAVAREKPLGRFDEEHLLAYFLATFIVRQLTSSWASWQINAEVRDGTLSARLLRPIHPLFAYAAESLAIIPLRLVLALPVAVLLLALAGPRALTHDPAIWALWTTSMLGGWLLSSFVSYAVGALAFFLESSAKLMDFWLAGFFVFSGYLVPIELFPPWMRAVIDDLPFRYQLGLPVELMTGAHGRAEALFLVAKQWGFVALAGAVAAAVWRRGLARFAAFGG